MKKIFILPLLLLLCVTAYSQKGSDIVYLKNGSKIKGTIIEQVPNVSLKIQSGENVFVYQMDEVEKIAKEQLQSKNNLAEPVELKTNYPNKGYRGFGEINIGTGKDDSDTEFNQIGFLSAHGYQMNSKLFVGGGAGFYDYYNDNDDVIMIPLFANVRFDFVESGISPFLDVRLGYSVGDNEGVYFTPSFGVRFSKFHISAGYLLQGYNYETIKGKSTVTEVGKVNSFFARIAIDWGARYKYVNVDN
jgi:hypothetical protein